MLHDMLQGVQCENNNAGVARTENIAERSDAALQHAQDYSTRHQVLNSSVCLVHKVADLFFGATLNRIRHDPESKPE